MSYTFSPGTLICKIEAWCSSRVSGWRKLFQMLLVVLLLPAFGCVSQTAQTKPGEETPSQTTTIRVGLQNLASDAAVFIGKAKGYFREQGLEVEIVPFANASEMIPALATGQVDVAGIAANAATFNAVARDVTIKIVADKGSSPPGSGFQALSIRKDLANQINDFKDLRGMTIAVTPPPDSTANAVDIDKALQRGGLTTKDVKIVSLGFADMNAAFANRSIDAAILNEPFVAAAQERGLAVRWKGVDEIYPSHQYGTIAYSPNLVKDKPTVAKRFMVAYIKAARDYNDAFHKDKEKEQIISVLTANTKIKDSKTFDKMVPAGINPNGYVNADSIAEDQEWYFARGTVKKKVDLKTLIDNQYVDYAIQRLGKYK